MSSFPTGADSEAYAERTRGFYGQTSPRSVRGLIAEKEKGAAYAAPDPSVPSFRAVLTCSMYYEEYRHRKDPCREAKPLGWGIVGSFAPVTPRNILPPTGNQSIACVVKMSSKLTPSLSPMKAATFLPICIGDTNLLIVNWMGVAVSLDILRNCGHIVLFPDTRYCRHAGPSDVI